MRGLSKKCIVGSRGDWGEMKQGQVETVTISFMGDSA